MSIKKQLIFQKSRVNLHKPIEIILGDDGNLPIIDHLVDAEITLIDFEVRGAIENDYNLPADLLTRKYSTSFTGSDNAGQNQGVEWRDSGGHFSVKEATWDQADKLHNTGLIALHDSEKQQADDNVYWGESTSYTVNGGIPWIPTNRFTHDEQSIWGKVDYLVRSLLTQTGGSDKLRIKDQASFTKSDLLASQDIVILSDDALNYYQDDVALWGESGRPPKGMGTKPIEPYIPDNKDPVILKKSAVFCLNREEKIVFGQQCKPVITIEDNVYLIENEIKVTRVDTGEEIEVFSVEMGITRDDFLWAGSIMFKLSELNKIEDRPTIYIDINHLRWKMQINYFSEEWSFNERMITASCSSTAQDLIEIPSTAVEDDSTAHQIAFKQLLNTGLETGYEINWQAQDWNIPAGLINYGNRSVVDVLSELTEASGDVLVAGYHNDEIIIKSRYPVSHWQNIEPLLDIPAEHILSYQESEEEEETAKDAVIVSGEDTGVTAYVRREGAYSDLQAEMVVHDLITDQRIARTRGINEINKTGVKNIITASLPLIKEIGYFYPSDALGINGKVGFISSINVSAVSDESGLVTVRYEPSIETHVEL